MSGLYGALHNQISYTFSPEYFHQFKFHQFKIPDYFHSRIGASIVGFLASWWMGKIISFFIVPFSYIIKNPFARFKICCLSYITIAVTALLIGISALSVAHFTIVDSKSFKVYGNKITHPVDFRRVGQMHNFSYAGGFVGIITGMAYIFVANRRLSSRK